MVLLLAQAISTLAMLGVIWFVQLVHYPLFAKVGVGQRSIYAAQHATRTTWVVMPLMFVELATSIALVVPRWRPAQVSGPEGWMGLGLVGVLWASTGLLQVPLHGRLQRGEDTVRTLVRTNSLRTAAWTCRAALVLLWLSRLKTV